MAITIDQSGGQGGLGPMQGYFNPGDLSAFAAFFVTFDSSYPAPGGEAFDASALFAKIDMVFIHCPSRTYGVYADLDNSKFVAYEIGTGNEVANGTDLSALKIGVLIFGTRA